MPTYIKAFLNLLDDSYMTIVAKKFRKFLKPKKGKTKYKFLELLNNPRVKAVKFP
jgi:hypothetical protein